MNDLTASELSGFSRSEKLEKLARLRRALLDARICGSCAWQHSTNQTQIGDAIRNHSKAHQAYHDYDEQLSREGINK